MGELVDAMEEDIGTSSKGEKLPNGFDMDIDMDDFDDDDDDDDDEFVDLTASLSDMGEIFLKDFCKKAATLFFNEYGLISHQINSYNDFIHNGLQKAFDSFGELVVEPGYDPSKKGESEWRYASVKFGKVTLLKPSFCSGSDGNEHNMLPRDARLQNMTYSSRMKVNVSVEVYTKNVVRSDKFKTGEYQSVDKVVLSTDNRDIIIGRIPVMVKSDLCWVKTVEKADCDFDHGGYFLIKGAEKVFIAQEQICLKRLWISNTQGWTVAYKSEIKRNRLIVRLVGLSKVEDIKGEKKGLTVYFLSTEIPLWILFFALDITSDKEVIDLIDYSAEDPSIVNIFFASIHDADEKCEKFRQKGEALNYVIKQIQGTRFPPGENEDCISQYLFPSLSSRRLKACFLGYMVKCLLEAYSGQRKCDNRDSFRNKRFELAGELLERELKVHIAHARRRMAKALQKDLYGDRDVRQIEHYLDASIVTNGLSRAFSTGAWSHPFKRMERISGVVASLGRTNPLQTMVDLRKTRQQVSYTGKVGDARYPHPSHWGRVCFLSTPDGENCGLVKNLAITGLVSTDISEPLNGILSNCGMEKLVDDTHTKLGEKYKVFLNGEWVGVCDDSHLFVAELRRLRRRKKLPRQVEIKRDELQREVRIFSDAGRILRPLLVVENLHKLNAFKGGSYTFQSLLDKGIIEFVGTEEEEDCSTAWGIKFLVAGLDKKQPLKYTHCELDMSFLLGLSCGIIPFANHDHARRVLYQAQKHSQQAIGFCTTNPNIRVDTLSHQLHYPQKPLFRTVTADCLGKPGISRRHHGMLPKPELFNGQNAIVAVNVHLGYNQEDSLVMNRASLERGMFRSEHIRSYKADVDNKEQLEKRRKFDDTVNFGKIQSTIGRVDSLDDDGFPFIGANLQSGDIVIGRCAESGADHSIKLKHTERGMVQKVVLSSNDEGKNFAVVSLRQVRSPCLGDKFSSMHGQKGVLGFLESQENFPFTRQGIVPDIVINPHAFPSRQTPGQLLEAALGKGIACGGSMRYATPFSTLSVEAITDQLHSAGFSRWGNERVYNGRTGEMVRSLIFMGPTFYQRLVHMAEDKVKFRNTGPVHPLTRQPVADRKRFGGIKFGEMERDCLIAHGASANLHERLFTLSDSSQMHICQSCKNVANVIQRAVPGGRKIRGPYCRGQYETSQQDTVMSTKPKVAGAQLELEVECANHSTNISPLAPAEISEPHSAPAMSKQSLMLHKDLPGQVLDQQNSDHPTSLSHLVVEMPAADGYSWRKYGQKQVKSSKSSRSYYKCSNSKCHAKKKVQRCDHSGRIIDVVYIGHHNHDHSQNKCNVSRGSLQSAKLAAGSLVDSVQKEDGADMSTCWEYVRQSSVHMAESEQQSSSSSNGNIGIKVEEQNNNELESKKLGVRQQKTNSRGFANAEVQEHGAEPSPKKRMKERSKYSDTVFEANKETKIVVHATADGGISSDGYRWRKYGQKMVKGNSQLRSYYRCTTAGCPSRKQVERAVDDATTATITYEGKHDHDMPVPKRQKGSESLARISSSAIANGGDQCKKTKSLSSCPRISNKWSFDKEGNMMDEKVLELGGEKALESAQTLLSIGIELRPC